MAYLANAISQTIDTDKIEVYRLEFLRRGIPEADLQPIFLGAVDGGYSFFPSVDQLISHRPRPAWRPYRWRSPEEKDAADAARKEFMAKVREWCGVHGMR